MPDLTRFLRVTVLLLLAGLGCTAAAADDEMWESGRNLYIKLAQQDEVAGRAPAPNQHPVTLDAQQITNALNTLEVWDKKTFFKDLFRKSEDRVTVFSAGQTQLLGLYISKGLQQATPGQDIVFALVRNDGDGLIRVENPTYTAGRVFYANDRLNVIIGDFGREGDRFQERMVQSSGGGEVKYYFAHGKRGKESDFERAIIPADGVGVHSVNGKPRLDWFEINVPAASAAYVAEQQRLRGEEQGPSGEAIRLEAEKLAKERRELRLEMARMRKEMKEMGSEGGSMDNRSIQERMATLNELRDQNLITEDEYEAKRREILDEI